MFLLHIYHQVNYRIKLMNILSNTQVINYMQQVKYFRMIIKAKNKMGKKNN